MSPIYRIFYSKTPKIKDSRGKTIAGSIASLEKIKLGGLDQWLLIRGHNINNPLLLYLHGGPGSSEMSVAYKFQRNIEKHFTIVHWDQRGTGKSFSRKIPKETMTLKQFLSDALELIEYLKKRFAKNKIFLLGHSWGTIMGTLLIHHYPEHFHTYIGIGQIKSGIENERVSYEFVLKKAKEEGNKKAIKQLEKITPPYGKKIKHLQIQRKWLNRYGGWMYGKRSTWPFFKFIFGSPEYSFVNIINLLRGVLFSLKLMWNEVVEMDLSEKVKKVEVPFYICQGRHDYNTPFELAEAFYNELEAPKKEFFCFEYSAHSPNYEELEKFEDVMINKILPEVLKKE